MREQDHRSESCIIEAQRSFSFPHGKIFSFVGGDGSDDSVSTGNAMPIEVTGTSHISRSLS
jgi:hypothetical protein